MKKLIIITMFVGFYLIKSTWVFAQAKTDSVTYQYWFSENQLLYRAKTAMALHKKFTRRFVDNIEFTEQGPKASRTDSELIYSKKVKPFDYKNEPKIVCVGYDPKQFLNTHHKNK
jgi:hypothetical protein